MGPAQTQCRLGSPLHHRLRGAERFLKASLKHEQDEAERARQKQIEEEQGRLNAALHKQEAEEQERKARRQTIALAVLAFLLAGTAFVAIYAFRQRGQANASRDQLEKSISKERKLQDPLFAPI